MEEITEISQTQAIQNPALEGQNSKTGTSDGINFALLKERFEINFSDPLPELNTNGAIAYNVTDQINPSRHLFALMCSNETPARYSLLANLKNLKHPNMLRLIDYGEIKNPLTNIKHLFLIYESPTGEKVSSRIEEFLSKKDNVSDFKNVLQSFMSILETLKQYNITHRAIRLNNVFFKDSTCSEIVLGDCAASFPALFQPDEYETIESLIADKYGRGNGVDKNDFYAVGALLTLLYSGGENLEKISTSEMLHKKMKKGSFTTLTENRQINKDITLALRGLLEDDIEKRWGLNELSAFFEGKIVNYSSNSTQESLTKSLVIASERVYSTRDVGIALLYHEEEALEIFKSGKILEWAKNNLESDRFFEKLEKLYKMSLIGTMDNHALVSQLCIYIAPNLPLKVGEKFIFPDSIAKSLYIAMKNQENLSAYIELFNSDVIRIWYKEQKFIRSPVNAGEFKAYISKKELGYGLERIMYDFDDDLPCLSPILGHEIVNSSTKLLRALEKNYSPDKANTPPYDKTILAYLRCKMGKNYDKIFAELNSPHADKKELAIIKLYVVLQNKYGPANLPNLCEWISTNVSNVINSYHNLKYRKHLENMVKKVAKTGHLQNILDLLENQEARNKDKTDYMQAMNDAAKLIAEYNRLSSNTDKLSEDMYNTGLKFTSILAVAVMLISFSYNIIFWMIQQ